MPNYSRRARMLRIKQANSLNFSTVPSTSPTLAFIMMPPCRFFMKFRGPKAHANRLRNLETQITSGCDFVALEFRGYVACPRNCRGLLISDEALLAPCSCQI
jgi:hypothetical protein